MAPKSECDIFRLHYKSQTYSVCNDAADYIIQEAVDCSKPANCPLHQIDLYLNDKIQMLKNCAWWN